MAPVSRKESRDFPFFFCPGDPSLLPSRSPSLHLT
jgi:hypothetical protein